MPPSQKWQKWPDVDAKCPRRSIAAAQHNDHSAAARLRNRIQAPRLSSFGWGRQRFKERETMSNQTQGARPLTPIGSTFVLAGHIFECIGHTLDRNGRQAEIPGRCIGKAPRQTKRGGQAANVPTINTALAPPTPAPPFTPVSTRPRKTRRPRAPRGDYRRFRPKPPPLIIKQEPWTLGNWAGLIIVLALVAASWALGAGHQAPSS